MSSTLNVTKQLTNEGWTLTATISPGGIIPQEIFVYENSGTTQLGPYYGVLVSIDLPRIQIFTGTPIATFGNNFVRYGTANILVPGNMNPDDVISTLTASVQSFSTAFQSIQSSSQTFTIT